MGEQSPGFFKASGTYKGLKKLLYGYNVSKVHEFIFLLVCSIQKFF
jgi:hypothetical protein